MKAALTDYDCHAKPNDVIVNGQLVDWFALGAAHALVIMKAIWARVDMSGSAAMVCRGQAGALAGLEEWRMGGRKGAEAGKEEEGKS